MMLLTILSIGLRARSVTAVLVALQTTILKVAQRTVAPVVLRTFPRCGESTDRSVGVDFERRDSRGHNFSPSSFVLRYASFGEILRSLVNRSDGYDRKITLHSVCHRRFHAFSGSGGTKSF